MYLTAEKIHNGLGWMPAGTVIEVSDSGTILSVAEGPQADAIFYEGVLCPGFVNAHCHLELSHMKGLINEHTGLIPFLKNIPLHRNDFSSEQKLAARHSAYEELLRNGVVAVGDISNTTDTLDLRAKDGLHFHTFVEALGFIDERAAMAFDHALRVYEAFAAKRPLKKEVRQTIVPHAPYTVSRSLFRLIAAHHPHSLLSVHNQESEDEDLYYKFKQGRVPELLHLFGIDDRNFVPSGLSSLQTYLPWMPGGHSFIFVHNTRTTRDDVKFATRHVKDAHWCLCPNANLYIENRLPDIDMLLEEGAGICIGTDSLASNHQLSILSELYTIKKHYSHLDWELLLSWGTYHGAVALQMQSTVGQISPGMTPGILQLGGLESAGAQPGVQRIL